MSDDFDAVRRLRPDRLVPADPEDPAVLARTKERLMAVWDAREEHAALATPDLYPRLAYRDELAAVEYLGRVFQLEEIREARAEFDGKHLCWMRIGTGIVMVSHLNVEVHGIHSPADAGLTTVMLNVYVADVDADHAHARRNGADITTPLADMFYGERRYEATDLEGHRWHFAQRFGPTPG